MIYQEAIVLRSKCSKPLTIANTRGMGEQMQDLADTNGCNARLQDLKRDTKRHKTPQQTSPRTPLHCNNFWARSQYPMLSMSSQCVEKNIHHQTYFILFPTDIQDEKRRKAARARDRTVIGCRAATKPSCGPPRQQHMQICCWCLGLSGHL